MSLQHLLRAFHCFEPEDRQIMFVPLLATLTTYEVHFGIEEGSGKPENEVNYLWHTEGPNKMNLSSLCLKKM